MCEILVVFEIENELQRQEFINKLKVLAVGLVSFQTHILLGQVIKRQ